MKNPTVATRKPIVMRAIKLMLRHPDHYNQHVGLRPTLTTRRDPITGCGSVGCVAGFVQAASAQLNIDSPVKPGESFSVFHTTTLLSTSHQRVIAFYDLGSWPKRFKNAFSAAETNKQKAKVAAARMRYWLKTLK